jgi:surfactin synthase thioesterase subunit
MTRAQQPTPMPRRDTWVRCLAPKPDARYRIVCFPFAGGGAHAFRAWSGALRDGEVWAAQLPGHVGRLNEPLATDLKEAARELARAVRSEVPGSPVLFGHSMGAWLALEVARALEGMAAPASALIVAGRAGPGIPDEGPISHLPDAQFVECVRRRYDGIPPEVAASAEIMELFVPILRADIAMMERYDPAVGARLTCPVLACGGAGDLAVPPSALGAWSVVTSGHFEQRTFPGGHFFLAEPGGAMLPALGAWLDRVV